MKLLKDFSKELEIYGNSLPAKFNSIVESSRNEDWFEKKDFIKNDDWTSLLSTSNNKAVALNAKALQITNEQKLVNDFVERLYGLKEDYKSHVDQNAETGFWTDVLNELNNSTEIPADDVATLKRQVENFSSSSSKLFYFLADQLENITTILNHSMTIALSKVYYNKYSAFISKLNLSEGGLDSCNSNNCYYYHKNIIETKLEEIRLLITNGDRDQAALKAQLLQEWLDLKIESKFLPILNKLYVDRGNGVTVGKQLMRISHLTRIALTYSVGMSWLSWKLSISDRFKKNNNLLKKTSTLTTALMEPDGVQKRINTLSGNPTQNDNLDVITEGTISQLEKIVVGPDQVLSKGKITLKRYNLTELSKESFTAWIRKHVNSIFELVPHNFCTKYSFEKSSEGAANPVKYNVLSKENKFLNIKSIKNEL